MALRPLILQPDASPYGANRALLRAIAAMPGGSVRPLVVFPYDGDALVEYKAAGCDVVVHPLAVLRRTNSGVRGILRLARERSTTGRSLAELARREGCDLVHTNSMTVVSGAIAARHARVPHVWQLREAPRERGLKSRGLAVLLRRADRVLAVSAAAAELAPGTRAVVIHDGYDRPEGTLPAAGIHKDGMLTVGMIGRISPSKAPDLAITALGILRERGVRDVRLILAGTVYPGYEPYARERILEQGEQLAISDQIAVVGWLDDPTPVLRDLDALIIATATGEGFPGAVLEALAHGVPVIDGSTGGTEELVLDGMTGIRCTPGSADAIADALEQLRDPALRARLGAAGREHAAQFTVQRSADQLLDAWRSVL